MIRKIAALLTVLLTCSTLSRAEMNAGDVEARVNGLLRQLSLEEKLSLLSGHDNRFIHAIPRLGIPQMKMSDGPVGAHNDGPDTAYPAAIALAASWNSDLALRFGKSIGSDAHARDVNFLLGPAMDIYRVPVCGRNAEYLGEDPYLSGTLAAQITRGIQSQGVCATLKHYAANDQEDHRGTVSVEADERTLREIYMRQFEIAVRDAHPWAVMSAYNCINGTHCTADKWLQIDVLKNEWGFAGIIMSDWGATHDTLACANAGLDIEMPGQDFFTSAKLLPLIQEGSISIPTIDDKVRHLLRIMVSMGYLDHAQALTKAPLDDPASAQTALQIAREGTVLLKNENNLLPLNRDKIKTLAIIGPNADPAITGCGGSSLVEPFHSVSVLAGIKAAAGKSINVLYIPISPQKQLDELAAHSIYQPTDLSGIGTLRTEFFDNKTLHGRPRLLRADSTISFQWDDKNPPPNHLTINDFSARWTGKILAPADGDYLFALGSHEGSRLFIDGVQVIDLWSGHPFQDVTITRHLEANKSYNIRIEFYSGWPECAVKFGWGPVKPMFDSSQQQQLASADAVILSAGYNPSTESEGFDRTYALPGGQDELIQTVRRINPRTILVINAGGNVDMNPWIDQVPAVLQAWYPGQNGNQAVAEILFGDICPSGHLPATFEKRFEDCPAFANYPGKDDKVYYKEGIFVGYRYFDAKNVEPRFPFGFGLSYTNFKFSNLKIKSIYPDGQQFTASVDITNTGDRPGSDVAEFYVGQDNPSLPRPPRWLAGYAKVSLLPGETKTCRVRIDPTSLCYWDTSIHHWKVDSGGYHIWAGDSSRALPVSARFEYP